MPPGKTLTPPKDVPIPVYTEEGVVLHGFHSNMLNYVQGDDTVGTLSTGSGLGGDYVMLSWTTEDGTDHRAVCYMRDFFANWVATIDPEAAAKLPRKSND